MQEIRVNAPRGRGPEVANTALTAGLPDVVILQGLSARTGEERDLISAEVSTPQARDFVHALRHAPYYNEHDFRITCRQILAIVDDTPTAQLTRPLCHPHPAISAELWQNTYITAVFVARAFVAAGVLAYGMERGSALTIAVSLLFTPFLPSILGISYGACSRDWPLVTRSALSLAVSTILSCAAAALVAALTGGPLDFTDFKPISASVLISLAIGTVAALSSADDVGRNYLIAVAAAAQYAIYPVWFGLAMVLGGYPPTAIAHHALTFVANLLALTASSAVTYFWLRNR